MSFLAKLSFRAWVIETLDVFRFLVVLFFTIDVEGVRFFWLCLDLIPLAELRLICERLTERFFLDRKLMLDFIVLKGE